MIRQLAIIAIVLSAVLSQTLTSNTSSPSPIDLTDFHQDVTLLYDNQLTGKANLDEKAALLISGSFTQKEAQDKCSLLGENLLSVQGDNSNILTSFLDVVDPKGRGTKYWINGKHKRTCSIIGRSGFINHDNCTATYPALCAHSSPQGGNDDTRKWQTKVSSGKARYTGYVVLLSIVHLGSAHTHIHFLVTETKEASFSEASNMPDNPKGLNTQQSTPPKANTMPPRRVPLVFKEVGGVVPKIVISSTFGPPTFLLRGPKHPQL